MAKSLRILVGSFFFVCVANITSGCVGIPGRNGTMHYLVIGFGLISVNEPTTQAVIASDSHILGIAISDQPGLKFAAGYSSSTVVTVADGADDVRVEVSKVPGRPLVVDVPRARLTKDIAPQGEPHD